MAKRKATATEEPSESPTEQAQVAAPATEAVVQFQNGVSWAGEGFSYIPGDIVALPESIARAREEAGMGKVVKAE
jgi:hypothetical protein